MKKYSIDIFIEYLDTINNIKQLETLKVHIHNPQDGCIMNEITKKMNLLNSIEKVRKIKVDLFTRNNNIYTFIRRIDYTSHILKQESKGGRNRKNVTKKQSN